MPRLAANAAVIGLTSTPIQPQRSLAFCFSFFSCVTVALHIGPSKAPNAIAACLTQRSKMHGPLLHARLEPIITDGCTSTTVSTAPHCNENTGFAGKAHRGHDVRLVCAECH